MTHAKRKILLTEDITNAMSVLNVPRVLGYQSALTNYTYSKAPTIGRREFYHSIKVFYKSVQHKKGHKFTRILYRSNF